MGPRLIATILLGLVQRLRLLTHSLHPKGLLYVDAKFWVQINTRRQLAVKI